MLEYTLFQYSIDRFASLALDHSAGVKSHEVVAAHAKLAAIDVLVVLAEQGCRPVYSASRLTESWHRAEVRVLADDRMFHVDEGLPFLNLLAIDELPGRVDRSNRDAALLAFLIELLFSVAATKFRDRADHDIRMLPSIRHFFELRSGDRRWSSHPIYQPAPLFNGNDE